LVNELTELHEDIVSGKTTFEEGQQLAPTGRASAV
jgi:hypothetical protein